MSQGNGCFLEFGCKRKYLKVRANSLQQSLLEQFNIMDRNSKKVKLLSTLFEKKRILYMGGRLCEQAWYLQNGNLKC